MLTEYHFGNIFGTIILIFFKNINSCEQDYT